MNLNELPLLYAFLKNNNYDINHVDLKWEKRTICFIEYFIQIYQKNEIELSIKKYKHNID